MKKHIFLLATVALCSHATAMHRLSPTLIRAFSQLCPKNCDKCSIKLSSSSMCSNCITSCPKDKVICPFVCTMRLKAVNASLIQENQERVSDLKKAISQVYGTCPPWIDCPELEGDHYRLDTHAYSFDTLKARYTKLIGDKKQLKERINTLYKNLTQQASKKTKQGDI